MKVTPSQNPFKILYQAMWHYARGFRYQMPIFLGLLTAGMLLTQSGPYILGEIVSELQHLVTKKSYSPQHLYHLLMFYGSLSLGFWMLHGPGRVIERRFAFKVRMACFNDLYNRVQSLPLSWQQDHHSGNIISRITTGTEGLFKYTEEQFISIRSMAKIFVPIAFLIYLAWPLAVMCLITTIITFIVIRYYDGILLPMFTKRREQGHSLSALVFDYIVNIQTIITLRLGLHTKKEIAHRLEQQREVLFKEAKWIEIKWAALDNLVSFNSVMAIVYIVWLFRNGSLTEIGLVVSLLQYMRSFSEVFYDLGSRYETIVRQANDYKSTAIIHDAYDALHQPGHEQDDEIVVPFTTIEVKDISFAYKAGQPQQLQEVNLTIKKGERIALVGESGSGKSTIMKLLRGLYPVSSGTLWIDGVQQHSFAPLKALTTLIPQEPEIFENTIRYNITMGVEHDDIATLEACRIAAFDTVLAQMPNGLDTDIREKGVNLSGGQKQRLALARGVFAIEDSAVILLDEPTSSIDGITEQTIYRNLFASFPDKCLIGSIHRLHLLTQFDTIYVFNRGRIVQSGTLNDLLAQDDGLFKTMWNAYQMAQDSDVL